jgi:hypothetical protein
MTPVIQTPLRVFIWNFSGSWFSFAFIIWFLALGSWFLVFLVFVDSEALRIGHWQILKNDLCRPKTVGAMRYFVYHCNQVLVRFISL